MKALTGNDIKIGEKFGRLTLLGQEIVGKYRKGKFLCDCGEVTFKHFSHVKNGLTTSCGCFQRESMSKRTKTHGMTKTNEFTIWQGMLARCHAPNSTKYYRYGARGISVCDRWRYSFENFFSDMGVRPSKKYSIERDDNDGDYTPNNCRWDIPFVQGRNTSRNHWIEHKGRKMVLQDWADELGFKQPRMSTMIKKMTIEEIIEKSILEGRKPILDRKGKKGNVILKP